MKEFVTESVGEELYCNSAFCVQVLASYQIKQLNMEGHICLVSPADRTSWEVYWESLHTPHSGPCFFESFHYYLRWLSHYSSFALTFGRLVLNCPDIPKPSGHASFIGTQRSQRGRDRVSSVSRKIEEACSGSQGRDQLIT